MCQYSIDYRGQILSLWLGATVYSNIGLSCLAGLYDDTPLFIQLWLFWLLFLFTFYSFSPSLSFTFTYQFLRPLSPFPLSLVWRELSPHIFPLLLFPFTHFFYICSSFPETHTKRQATQLLAQLTGWWGQRNWKSVQWKKKYFVLGRLEQLRQKKSSCTIARQAQRNNQGRAPFICTLWVPVHLSFDRQHGQPLYSLSV